MSEPGSSRIQIVVALIGLVGVIATALITNWEKLFDSGEQGNARENAIAKVSVGDGGNNSRTDNPKPINLDSQGTQATAKVGESRISEYNRADILISAFDKGSGVAITSLSRKGHIGNARSEISFPEGWRLHTRLVPAGGCVLKPTHVYNDGKGSYTLSVMTIAKKGACPWKVGEYHYLLEINLAQYRGRSTGKIVIE